MSNVIRVDFRTKDTAPSVAATTGKSPALATAALATAAVGASGWQAPIERVLTYPVSSGVAARDTSLSSLVSEIGTHAGVAKGSLETVQREAENGVRRCGEMAAAATELQQAIAQIQNAIANLNALPRMVRALANAPL